METPVIFGDSDAPRPISAKPPEIKGTHVELFEVDASSPCITSKQLFEHVKSLKGCDEFDLFFMPAGGGEWLVELVSPMPQNGVVYLDCNTEVLG